MANENTAIQKFSNEDQRLALLAEYSPHEHLVQWTALNKRTNKTEIINYYPAAWRLYELRLRYPTAKFDINIILIDQERNFCIVQAKLYIGSDYETAEIRSIAHKQGMLTELDRVETKAKARAARDLGISTELALDMDDTPENEVAGTVVGSTVVAEERPQTQTSSGHQALPPAKPKSKPKAQPTAPEQEGMILESQINALLNLYGKLDQTPPSDLDKWSFEEASVGIRELSARLKSKAS